MKEIGNLVNRIMENRMYCDGIEVGTKATEYLYSDRNVWEVIEVIDDKNIVMRRMKAIRTDGHRMSDAQSYRYESDENAMKMGLRLIKGKWRIVYTFDKKDEDGRPSDELWNIRYFRSSMMTEKQWADYEAGKVVTKVGAAKNISFGIADAYYDSSF